jgi:hypothetical protein
MTGAFRIRLWRRDDLAEIGVGHRAVRRHLHGGRLRTVRPGVFVWAEDVSTLSPEHRVVVRARALTLVSRHRPVFSHLTAAAIHGMPLYAVAGSALHVITASGRPSGGAQVVRHDGELAAGDVVEICGLQVTSPVRTVADVARTSAFSTAVCVTDAALHSYAHTAPHAYDASRAAEFLAAAGELAHRSVHGVRKAERVLDFADGRAQLPAESVSRVHLATLRFPRPDLQVHVPGPYGTDYWVDFGFASLGWLGEADGKTKYRDPLLRGGLSVEEVMDREKQREDWIRGTTQLRFARWGFEHLSSHEALGDRLARFGIRPAG